MKSTTFYKQRRYQRHDASNVKLYKTPLQCHSPVFAGDNGPPEDRASLLQTVGAKPDRQEQLLRALTDDRIHQVVAGVH